MNAIPDSAARQSGIAGMTVMRTAVGSVQRHISVDSMLELALKMIGVLTAIVMVVCNSVRVVHHAPMNTSN